MKIQDSFQVKPIKVVKKVPFDDSDLIRDYVVLTPDELKSINKLLKSVQASINWLTAEETKVKREPNRNDDEFCQVLEKLYTNRLFIDKLIYIYSTRHIELMSNHPFFTK